MARQRWALFIIIPFLLAGIGLTATTRAAPTAGEVAAVPQQAATATPPASLCVVGADKWVDPQSVLLGQSAGVTMVVTHTCPSVPLPIDMVIVVDESFSMTKGGGSSAMQPTLPPDPDPSAPPPTLTPGSGQLDPGGTGGEPPFCGGIQLRTAEPTWTATRPPSPRRTPAPHVPPTIVPTPIQEHAGGEDQIRVLKSWVRDFVTDPEIEADFASGRLRMGFVSFNRRVKQRQLLTTKSGDIVSSANRIRGEDITRIKEGLNEAARILDGTGARLEQGQAGRIKVVVLLSDFEYCRADVQKMAPDVFLITVGFGVQRKDLDKLYLLATDRKFAFERTQPRSVVDVIQANFVHAGRPVTIQEMTIRDELTADMLLDVDAVDPPTVTVAGQLIEWPFAAPANPVTTTYRVEPLSEGLLPVSVMADVEWRDSLGGAGKAIFPDVDIQVVAQPPTPTNTPTLTLTPTATATATPTETPTPAARYLPMAYKQVAPEPTATVCVPELQTMDVALVIDTSTSMSEPTRAGGQAKMDAAIEAAQMLVELLKDADQATVVGFNATASLKIGLTNDHVAVRAALAGLRDDQASGTNIYAGLRTAYDELTGQRHVAGHTRSIVLVTDGRHNDPQYGVDDIRQLAAEIHDRGIDIVTVGLGSDLDEDLLRDVASEPGYYFRAPDASDLLDIYREIVRLIPCP